MASEPVVTLVDSSVLLDVATDDPEWTDRSASALARATDTGIACINPIVYAVVRREPLPYSAGFVAGKAFLAFLAYRRRGGVRRTPLPDFYIGAHAAVAGHRVLTRDAARYRTYFPVLAVDSPGSTG